MTNLLCLIAGHRYPTGGRENGGTGRHPAWCDKGYKHRCVRCNKVLWVQPYDGGGWP